MKLKKAVVRVALATAVATLVACTVPHKAPPTTPQPTAIVQRIGPDYLYPNPSLTPGKADTLILADLTKSYNGQTYSQAHRNVGTAEKSQVLAEYHEAKSPGEIDHFYPLCAGGSNDITNLWPQPELNQWNGQDFGFHAKDKLETYICAEVKAGKLDPREAFARITTDWVKYYLDLGLDKKFGSTQTDPVE